MKDNRTDAQKVETAKRMLDRLIDKVGEMELDCDYEVYESLLKIQFVLAD